MFTTQIKSQCRTRPATTASYGEHRNANFFEDEFTLAQKRYKDTRQKARLLQKQYQNLLSNVNSLKKSIQVTRHKTCRHRLNFMKTFQVKKIKLKQFQLQQHKKLITQASESGKKKQNKIMKLNSELQSMVIRADIEKSKQKSRMKNRAEKLERKSMLLENRANEQFQGRQRYQRIRQSQIQLKQKKQNIADYVSMRARHNYWMKMEKEREMIQSYDDILRGVEKLDETLVGPYSTVEDTSFLITTKKEGF